MSVTPETGERIESFNPATGQRLGAVPAVAPRDVAAIVDDIADVQPFWAQLPLAGRARYMRRTAQVLIDNLDELSAVIAGEHGKPRAEAYLLDLLPSIDALHRIAADGERLLSGERLRRRQPLLAQKRSRLVFEPLGVIAVIASSADPWSTPFGQVATALMCGNGVALAPGQATPLIGQRIQAVFERAGVPAGLVRAVHGPPEAASALVESGVAKVFFAGAPEAGRDVAVRCAELGKGSLLELGGRDPQLVLGDAPLEHAVAGCLWAGFAGAGQAPAAIDRVYVVREVADRFADKVVAGARGLRVGDPLEWTTEVGPLASPEQRDRLGELVDDAVAHGATLRCGGPVGAEGLSGAFFAPGVLTGVTGEMRVMREQIPGPLVPIQTVDSDEEAIRLANDSPLGIGASVWTLDRDKGARIARRLEAGTVWLNDHLYSHGAWQCSWGGVKGSGLGAVHDRFAFYECVDVKHVAWDPSHARRFYWHPYDETLGQALEAAAQLLFGRDADKRGALRRGAVPLARLARRGMRGTLSRG